MKKKEEPAEGGLTANVAHNKVELLNVEEYDPLTPEQWVEVQMEIDKCHQSNNLLNLKNK